MHAPSNYAQKSYIKPYTDSIIKMSKIGHFVFKYFLGGVAALPLTFDCRFEVLKSTQRAREGRLLLLRTPRTRCTSASNVAACRRTRCYQQYLGKHTAVLGNGIKLNRFAQVCRGNDNVSLPSDALAAQAAFAPRVALQDSL